MSAVTNNIIGQFEANLNAQAGTDRVAADKNTFLKLLVAQLTHQDPLNPTEDKEFIAQLAQFTSVEELQNLNKGMESLNDSYLRQQVTNAVNMIGKRITAKGDNVYLQNIDGSNSEIPTYQSEIIMTFPRDAAQVVANVYTKNADDTAGRLVYSGNIGSWAQGSWKCPWNGKDNSGKALPDGNYIVSFTAVDESGNEMLVDTKSIGTVALVETQADGNHKLILDDNRVVYFNNIEYITDPEKLGGGTAPEPEDDKDPDGEGDKDGEDGSKTPETEA